MVDERLAEWLPSIFRFALSRCRQWHIAEDLAQEAVVRWVRQCERQPPDDGRTWMFRVVENLWKDHLRRSSADSLDDAFLRTQPSRDVDPTFATLIKDELKAVLAAMDQLPDRQRTVLYLVACEQLTPAQVAQVLDIEPNAVRVSLSIARSRIRTLLDPSVPGPKDPR
jgi:RNA polymerase sigma-70 factor, ECF subfamily